MSAAGGVTAEELVLSLRKRHAALPSEIGTFVVFEACEAMLSRAPLQATLSSLTISEEGSVSLPSAERTDQEGAARSLHGVLTSLLVAAGPPPTPALLRLAEEGPLEGRWTLDQMRDDLEAALVPLNRTASRRVLARLVRETTRGDIASHRPKKGPTFSDLDRELSNLLGVEHEHTDEIADEPMVPIPRTDDTVIEPIERLDDAADDISFFETRAPSRAGATEQKTIVDTRTPYGSSPSAPRLRGFESISERPQGGSLAPPKGKGTAFGIVLVLLALGLVGTIFAMRPELLQRLTDRAEAPPKPTPPVVLAPRAGDLIVRVSNERAQILRFVGHGPATVKHLPIGVAHEFVAIADGALPTRVVVPADAQWETTPEGPRYEVAMQAGGTLKPGAALDLGDTRLPQDVGAPRGGLGSVRIVTTPRGAKIYQLIGFAPEAKLQDVALDQTEELLIWKHGHEPVQRVVAPSDYVDQGGRRAAAVDVTLTELGKRARTQ